MELINILDIIASGLFITALVGICILSLRQRRLGKLLKKHDYDLEVLGRLTAIEDILEGGPVVGVEFREEEKYDEYEDITVIDM